MEHFRWQLTTSGSGRRVSAIPAWCVYESTGFHLGNIGLNRSQNWLAREAGISPGYLSTLVNKGRAPSGRIRRRMQKTLGVNNFQELFRLEDSDDG